MLVPPTNANRQLIYKVDLTKKGLSKFPKNIKKTLRDQKNGGLAEWLKALAWKASLLQKSNASSNLASSAKLLQCNLKNRSRRK